MDRDFSSIDSASIPYELTGQVPRRLRLSKNGNRMAAAAAIMLALAVASTVWIGFDRVQHLLHRAALRSDGRETVGEIKRVWSASRSMKTRVSYTFAVNGVPFVGEELAPHHLAASLRDSGPLPIRYLPSNPAVNHPAAWEWSLDSDSVVAPILWTGLVLFLITALRSERRLVAKGLPAVGEITKCAPARRGGFSVNFDFCTEDGCVTKGSGWSQYRRETGERVCVLYLPENPKRNLSYPALNYRVVQ
jgi:hypothetical protein